MFRPADPLFRHGKQQLAIRHDARRRIMHLRIINSQSELPLQPVEIQLYARAADTVEQNNFAVIPQQSIR